MPLPKVLGRVPPGLSQLSLPLTVFDVPVPTDVPLQSLPPSQGASSPSSRALVRFLFFKGHRPLEQGPPYTITTASSLGLVCKDPANK